MQFRVLGPLEARASDGRLVHLGAEKQRVLLAALLLSANQPVSAERLIEDLWGERPPPTAPAALRTYASTLRGVLGLGAPGSPSRIVARHGSYLLRVAEEDLDMLVFEELTARGLKAQADGDTAAAAEALRRAAGLWRGRALEDVPLDGRPAAELARLEELRLTGLEAWLAARLALGQHAEVVAEHRAEVAAHPLRELLQASWLLALYRCGRQAEALDAYRALREHLVGELGIEPSRPLQRLHQQMLAAEASLDPPDRPSGAAAVVPRQLPPDVAGFTGRGPELDLLLEAVDRAGAGGQGPPPIVAVDGVAGVGKSALAIHAAHRLADRFPDGHLYADLQGTTPGRAPATPLAVLSAFLRALDAPDRDVGDLAETAARFRALTARRRVLILLDNARDTAQVELLLPAGAGCAVLATSRRVLSTLDSAVRVHLDVLPPAEAATLLDRRAGAPRMAADPDASAEVARLCGYLPLALRIAASRLAARPSWPVRALVDRLADAQRRLDELQVGDLGVRASFQVSLQALRNSRDPGERAAAHAFTLIGVLDAADLAVPAAARLLDQPEPAVEAALERLVDAQLLDSPAPGRYQLHDLLRLFARECATESHPPERRTEALLRVLTWYRVAARETLRLLRPGHRHPVLNEPPPAPSTLPFDSAATALDWLEAERPNLVAAIQQALASAPEVPAAVPVATAQALVGFFEVRGFWLDWIGVNESILAAVGDSAGAAAGYAHRDLGVAHELRGDYPRAQAHLETALAIFERAADPRGQVACLTSLAIVHHRVGRRRLAVDCNRRSLAIRRELGDRRGEAINLTNLGATLDQLGEYAEAAACYRDALEIFSALGDRPSAAQILNHLGVMYERDGRHAEAIRWHERSLETFQQLGDRASEAGVIMDLGRAYRLAGRYGDALASQRAGLAISEHLGDRLLVADCLRELGSTFSAMGQPGPARDHWRRALAGYAELGVPEADEVRALLAP